MKATISELKKRINALMLLKGEALVRNGAVGPLSTFEEYGIETISAQVSDGGTHYVRLSLYDDGDFYSSCGCAHERVFGICHHCAAVLLEYEDMLKAPKMTENSEGARRLLLAYSPQLPSKCEKVNLTPVLSADSVPVIAFKIGKGGSSYIIKDLAAFVKHTEEHEYFEYGSKLGFAHSRGCFEGDSAYWYDFIQDRVTAFTSMAKQYTYRDPAIKDLPLSGRDFDLLFDKMYPSRHINNRAAGGRFDLIDADPDIDIQVIADNHGGYTVVPVPMPGIIRGAQHNYAVIGTSIYRMTEEFSTAMLPLIKCAAEADEPLTFSSDGVKRFARDVLPRIESHTNESALTLLENIRPEKLDARYLIDMPERGMLTASVSFYYGDRYVDSAATEEDYPDIRRNTTLEKDAIDALLEFFDAPEEAGGLYTITDEERIYDFLKSGSEKLEKTGQVFITDRLKNINIVRPMRPSVSLKIESGLLNFGVDTGEFPAEELALLMKRVREKRRYYRLKDGSFMGLENGEMNSFAETADTLGIKDSELEKGGALMPLYRAMYLDTAFKSDKDVASVSRDAEFKRLIRDFKTVEDSDFEAPEELEKVLRSYQKTGFRWLRTLDAYRFGGILADDMGLGKTLQVLSYIKSLKDEGKLTGPVLIVCPASLVLNWGDEAAKWTPSLKTALLIASSTARNNLAMTAANNDIMVTSYDTMRRDIDRHEDIKYYACILDEAQYIKNQETQSAKCVRRINAQVHFALTGTPVENRLSELWSIFEFLMPGYLDSYSKFRDKYEKPITNMDDLSARAALTKLVHPFILRRLKSDVLTELPPKTEMNCYIEMGETQRKYYLAYVEKLKEALETADSSDRMKILAMLTRLRQLCCDPALWVEGYNGGSCKLDELLRMVDELIEGGHRMLIFSQFTSMLAIIEKNLDEAGIKSFTLKGDTPIPERAELVRRFNAGEVPVFLISLKAGGVGLNLTGADTVVHFDPWWNTAAQNQATDRCYRIGQDKAVTVYKLIAKDTIEEKIIKLQDIKLSLARVVTDNADGGIMDMSKEELIDLISSREEEEQGAQS